MRRSETLPPDSSQVSAATVSPTAILDYRSGPVQAIVRRFESVSATPLAYLQTGYHYLREQVRPAYTVDELQPTSLTLIKCKGSCSQRFACLESLARAVGIATRVHGLWIAGKFWDPRFTLTKWFIPSRILLAWPQFCFEEQWVSVEELFGSTQRLAEQNPHGFTNEGESLFDAIDHVALDFDGKTTACGSWGCDLSRFVVGDAGLFESRDELFAAIPSFQHTLRGRVFEFLYGGRTSN